MPLRRTDANAHVAEVARRGDEAGAEDVMPDAIHHDAGGQRVARIGEPFREGEAALLLGRVGQKIETAEFVFEY